ncbi:hypothetical protein CBG54_08600 [Fusobacterium polymorphum]|jgi:transcriptional regulator, XRE family|uniref:HTH cro/C1-type domain-containing protein n=2 Tax=Fusobacterium nucleatum subsp. polymorphum TaxID=76857 RepID=A0A2C6AY72_FUSNP|nr:hypothetical protein CBG54_08600 [Fusobacterium polymorphum]
MLYNSIKNFVGGFKMAYEIKDVIAEIKNKREELKYSYKDLEAKTGISASTLFRYETMETSIPLDKFQIICKELGLNPEKLLMSKIKKISPITKKNYLNEIEKIRKEKGLSKNEAKLEVNLVDWVSEASSDGDILSVMATWGIPTTKNPFYLSNNKNKVVYKLQTEFIEKTDNLSEEEAQKIRDSIMPIIDLLVNKK